MNKNTHAKKTPYLLKKMKSNNILQTNQNV